MASRQALTDLPDLILEQIFSCIDVFGRESDRLSFSRVCRKFRDIERRRTVLELISLNFFGANPVKALPLYPNLTALKADATTCTRWFGGQFGEVHNSRHSFRLLHLDCKNVYNLHPLFHDLMPGVPNLVRDSWRPEGAPTGPRGTLEELVISGRDGLDLTCVRDESPDLSWPNSAGGVASGRLRKLTLSGTSKNGYQLIFDALGPALVSLDVSGLKRGNFRDSQIRVGEFVEDGILTQLADQCSNLKELFLGPGRSGNSFLKGLEAIAEKCVQLETLGQDTQRGGGRCVWPRPEHQSPYNLYAPKMLLLQMAHLPRSALKCSAQRLSTDNS
ncbi:hypothetical protein KFL_004410130 [Klebsormidium nitens]|uniref:F-box domain-containing protein n=1 Tax=Klebsormidium nitens TaxID=105231 RepID=A0A1Y1IC97_KLENI|nr:hypothetical protein KFL_004410130 [Klebsormidium nitens]|eukprot:GAQ88585.1 hypothetical protein KFL_004410130 [Klebsormidium nitens]